MWKHFERFGSVFHILLDAKVVHTQIEVERCSHADRAEVSRPMRSRAHLIHLRQAGDFSQMRDSSRMNDRGPYVINELFLYELLAIVNRVEDFPGR